MITLTPRQITDLNNSVTLYPDAEHPYIEIGGVLVFVYADANGLRVSVDLDSVEPPLYPEGAEAVPMKIKVQHHVVAHFDEHGNDRTPQP